MLRATRTLPAGGFDAAHVLDTVMLDHDDRRRRRFSMTGAKGTAFLVDLAEVPALGHGDGLVLEDGRVIAVAAKPERLVEFSATDPHVVTRIAWHLGNRHTPTEIRAGALRIRDDYVLVEMIKKLGTADIRFVEDIFQPEGGAYGLGGTMGHDHAPPAPPVEDPEMAAAIERRRQRKAARAETAHVHGPDCGHDHHDHGHDHGHAHDHDHGHDHGHDHAHGHDHGHGHDHEPHHATGHDHDHGHVHGPDCGHDHAHDHDHDHGHGDHGHGHDKHRHG